MPARLYLEEPIVAGAEYLLPPGAVRHVQVLRLQPGDPLVLFDGRGGEYDATLSRMGRREAGVRVGTHRAVERELARAVTLAVGMPANERMDALVEKATELGAAALQPLLCERAVLRPHGERAARKRQHWCGIAAAAAEQSGRTRLPRVNDVLPLAAWLNGLGGDALASRWLLDPQSGWPLARAIAELPDGAPVTVLSGPEGGLSVAERAQAQAAGFVAVGLGPRVLRADTAPLAALACLAAVPARAA